MPKVFFIDANDFLADFSVDNSVPLTHRTSYGRFKGTQRLWHRKSISNESRARLELLAQEFFRLIIPHQPETRLGTDYSDYSGKKDPFFIYSESIQNFTSLPPLKSLINTPYQGLGKVVLMALFLEEIDLKPGNIGLDEKNRVCKIDGDLCFASMVVSKKYEQEKSIITTQAIDVLPNLSNDYPYNWLDLREMNTSIDKNVPFAQEISMDSNFRQEVNEAILSILLCPHDYIAKLIDTCCPDMKDTLIDFFDLRREQLRLSALGSKSFMDFLQTPAAKQQALDSFREMSAFTLQGDYLIIEDSVNNEFLEQFDLQAQALLGMSLYQDLTHIRLSSPTTVVAIEGIRSDTSDTFDDEEISRIRLSRNDRAWVHLQVRATQSMTPPPPKSASWFGLFSNATKSLTRRHSTDELISANPTSNTSLLGTMTSASMDTIVKPSKFGFNITNKY